MAVTSKVLARTAAATSSTTLYTSPNTSTTAVVTNIVLANAATSASTATIALDGVVAVPEYPLPELAKHNIPLPSLAVVLAIVNASLSA